MIRALSHVRTWIFDLDNTLYPPVADLFGLIDDRMGAYIAELLACDPIEARRVQKEYFLAHGTTLAGLMQDHGVDPHHFLDFVHDIPLDRIAPDMAVIDRIASLPGRRIVFTNGSAPYAEKVLEARGLSGLFEAVYGVEHADYAPKPRAEAFEKVFGKAGIRRDRAAMFEDDPRNLAVPHAMGLRTVLVAPARIEAPHIGHHTDDLARFLTSLRHPRHA